jgi:hypothetical protein
LVLNLNFYKELAGGEKKIAKEEISIELKGEMRI